MSFLEKLFVNNYLWNKLNKFLLTKPFLKQVRNSPKNILEIGCGIGKTTKSLAEFFPKSKITAVDYDNDQIKIAKQSKIPKVSFEQGDATDLRFKSNSFDAVFAFLVFHHVENYKKALKECFRVLKNQGYLYVIDVGALSPHFFQSLFPAPKPFSKSEFAEQIIKAGFVVEHLSGNNIIFRLIAKK